MTMNLQGQNKPIRSTKLNTTEVQTIILLGDVGGRKWEKSCDKTCRALASIRTPPTGRDYEASSY